MTNSARRLLLWGPRILGILFGLYVGVFALDALDEGIPELLLHLAPAMLVLLLVAASWRWEWVGGTTFLLLAAAFAVLAWQHGHLDWLMMISGPLMMVGALFLVSWRHHSELHVTRGDPGMVEHRR